MFWEVLGKGWRRRISGGLECSFIEKFSFVRWRSGIFLRGEWMDL